jgi:hypothetical protein
MVSFHHDAMNHPIAFVTPARLVALLLAFGVAVGCEALSGGDGQLTQQKVVDISGGDIDCNNDSFVDSECEKCTAEGFVLRVCFEDEFGGFPGGGGGGGPRGPGGGTGGGSPGGSPEPPAPQRAPGACGNSDACIALYEEAKEVYLGGPCCGLDPFLPSRQVFWSGYWNQQRAEWWAKQNGYTTLSQMLEATARGGILARRIESLGQAGHLSWDEAREVWKLLSRRWASLARGDIYLFVDRASPDSLFQTVEYRILRQLEEKGLVRLYYMVELQR